MKRRTGLRGCGKGVSLILIVVVALLVAAIAGECGAGSLESSFADPPDAARPWVYWFWMSGNITREGIRADLEAMREVGIGGCIIMHIKIGDIGSFKLGNMPPDGPVRFMSKEFRELFKYAVEEADRLGLQLDMNNADGFTGSGGPWVPVEKSMKKLVWTEAQVKGGGEVAQQLEQPETIMDFYRDIAVIAFPRQRSLTAQMKAEGASFSCQDEGFKAELMLDGDVNTSSRLWNKKLKGWCRLLISFNKPYTADTLVLKKIGRARGRHEATLEVSDDGKKFRKVGSVCLKWYPAAMTNTVRFDACSARYYRITFAPGCQYFSLGELELGCSNMVHNWEAKAGFTRYGEWGGGSQLYTDRKLSAGGVDAKSSPISKSKVAAIGVNEVIDLTGKMDAKGKLSWKAPMGEWSVLRIGYTSTGIKNHPASPGGHGLECDKLRKEGVECAFDGMLKKMIGDCGELVGRSFTYAHIDSWEVGIQNWTEGMAESFKKVNGYDLTRFYPLLVAGYAVGSNDESERFLWDLRRTILDMMADNYLGEMQKLCNKNGLKFSSEAGGRQTFLFSPIYLLRRSDLPMGEFWPHEKTPRVDNKAAASMAHIYGKKLVGAESFTGAGDYAAWQSHPYRLKGIGDEAFCLGVNQYVMHYCVHQAYEGMRPGFAMGPWGIHFDRMNTWWNQSKGWLKYLARCQYMLRQGNFVADVLYFPGEGAPHYLGKRDRLSVPLPSGYDFDGCDRETLLKRVKVRDGRLEIGQEMSYRYLMLADDRAMTPELSKRIRELVQEGAKVIGPKPESSPSLQGFPQCDKEVKKSLRGWKSVWGKSFAEIARGDKLAPDFEFSPAGDKTDIRYIHRREGNTDIYYVANRKEKAVEVKGTFRLKGKQPELWHPERGTMRDLGEWQVTGEGRTNVPLRFGPLESYFIVFKKPGSAGKAGGCNFPEFKTVTTISGPWKLEFPDGQGAPASMEIQKLASWTEQKDFNVKHFSGTARYKKKFLMDKEKIAGKEHYYLDLGDVQVIAEVTLNGRDLGILWKPPFRVEISKELKAGKNELEVKVTNLWVNRMIGDEYFPDDTVWEGKYLKEWPDWFFEGKERPESRRKTLTVVKNYKSDSELLPSGLLGPVRIYRGECAKETGDAKATDLPVE